AHISDDTPPTHLSLALVGDASEQAHLSMDGREEPQGVCLPRDGRSRIERRRHSLLSNTRSQSAGEIISRRRKEGIQCKLIRSEWPRIVALVASECEWGFGGAATE